MTTPDTTMFVHIAPAEGATQPLPPLPPPAPPAPTTPTAPARLSVTISLPVWALTALPGVLALALVLAVMSRIEPATGMATTAAVVTSTPSLAVPVRSAPPAIIAYHAPAGAVAGEVALTGDVAIIEQYQGWARFRLSGHPDLWAPIPELARAVSVEQIATAPELMPTAVPTAAPQIVYVPAPAPASPAPAAPALDIASEITLADEAPPEPIPQSDRLGVPAAGWSPPGTAPKVKQHAP